jgi:AraC-like DNA-binding protein
MMRHAASEPEIDRTAPPAARLLAKGPGWSLSEFLCHADASCRPFEERHSVFTIAAVVEGTFNYHADTGKAVLYPGAIMLGNYGACYQCGHQHSAGDRCIALQLEPERFGEIAGSGRYAFAAPVLPSADRLLPQIARMERLADFEPLAAEEAAADIVEAIVEVASGAVPPPQRVSARDERRISQALRHIEEHAEEPIDLEGLAGVAGMSKYHFLRVFRRSLGVTPYRCLLAVRMRRAAARLSQSQERVSAICYEAGFGDLSTFNHRFRELFGASPMAFRKAGKA